MSTLTTPQNGTLQPKAPERIAVHDDGPISHLMDTGRFEHLFRIASTLARSALTPKHLKGASQDESAANCFRVVNQAIRWNMDPFAVADETYVVGGKLGYQGKLVAAVVHTRSGLHGRLKCEYEGAGDNRKITISGRFENEAELRTIDLTVKQAKTANKLWETDPDQKLWYSGVTKWARRHCPEVLLGVLTEDDLDRAQERFVEAEAIEPPRGGNARLASILPPLPPVQESHDEPSNTNDSGPTEEDLRGTVNHVDPLPAILGGIRKAKTAEDVDRIVLEEQGQGGHSDEVQKAIWEAGEERKKAIAKK
jgi:hypothetical protein